MSDRARPKILSEGLRILLILGGFFLLQDQILGVRHDISGQRAGIVFAETRNSAELGATRDQVEDTLKDCVFEITKAQGEIKDAILRLDDRRAELLDLLDERTREMEGSLVDRIEIEQEQISSTRFALEAGTARLERIFSGASRDPQEMKRKMIHPTVQLKGNGTVGSGVIIYSQPLWSKGVASESEYATFVLTAYHVVVEVLGDRADDGTVEEVQILPEADSGAMEVFAARLVVYDRPRDLALLRLKSARRFLQVAELMPPAELGAIDIFSRAYAVGCPLGNRPLPTVGEISSKSKIVADQVFWMLSAPTFFGNSGGGVYLAESSKLIGVSSMIYTYGKTQPAVVPHMGLFVPLDVIYRWLDSEGYEFVHKQGPIPGEMEWKCAPDSQEEALTNESARGAKKTQ